MQAVVLLDNCGCRAGVDAVLGACGNAGLAADALAGYSVAASGVLCSAKSKAGTLDWLLRQVKPFSRALVNLEDGKRGSDCSVG